MGAFIFLVLLACGVPSALALAVFGGFMDLLPYIGIFLTVGPVVLAAATQGTTTAIVVFILMLAYEELESRVLVPLVYGRSLRLPSSVVFFSLILGTALAGIIGALLALPMAAAVLMLVEELRVELPGKNLRAHGPGPAPGRQSYRKGIRAAIRPPLDRGCSCSSRCRSRPSARRRKKPRRPASKLQRGTRKRPPAGCMVFNSEFAAALFPAWHGPCSPNCLAMNYRTQAEYFYPRHHAGLRRRAGGDRMGGRSDCRVAQGGGLDD